MLPAPYPITFPDVLFNGIPFSLVFCVFSAHSIEKDVGGGVPPQRVYGYTLHNLREFETNGIPCCFWLLKIVSGTTF